jgi:hypothetical protein
MERAVDGAIRLGRAWKALSRERRSAAIAAAVLWLSLFLPWYQASVVSRNPKTRSAAPTGESLSGWAAFSAVEALILILSLGVVLLLFLRVEGRISHAPGSDGWVITAAGAISVFLVVLGFFSAPSPANRGQYVLSTGLEWGIFLALLAAIGLTWAGGRVRRSLDEDPILAGSQRSASRATWGAPAAGGATTDVSAASPGAQAPTTGGASRASKSPSAAPPAPSKPSRPAARPVQAMTEANMLGVVEPLTDETKPGAGQPLGVVEPLTDETKPGAGQPLTAAGAQPPRPVRAAPSGPDPVVPQPSPAPHPAAGDRAAPGPKPEPRKPDQRKSGDSRAEDPTVADLPGSGSRSSPRLAENPAWNDPERPVGWLTAPSKRGEPGAEDKAPRRQDRREEPEQLTMPLDQDE